MADSTLINNNSQMQKAFTKKQKPSNIKLQCYNLILQNMSTLSVPLTPELENMIDKLIQDGVAGNKAELARKAAIIERYVEEVPAAATATPERESNAA